MSAGRFMGGGAGAIPYCYDALGHTNQERVMVVHAIFEKGVFVPRDKVDLPDKTLVTFDPKPVLPFNEDNALKAMKGIIETLGKRVASGDSDVAARHNEHQP